MKNIIFRYVVVGAAGLTILSFSEVKSFFGFHLGDGDGFGVGVGSRWDGYDGGPYWGRRYHYRQDFPAFGIRVGPRYYNVSDDDSLEQTRDELKQEVNRLTKKLEKRKRIINTIEEQKDALQKKLSEKSDSK